MPENHNTASVIESLALAHQHYKPLTKNTCVLMIVQGKNFNIADERPIEYGLIERDVKCFRCEWNEVLERTSLAAPQSTLFYTYPWSGDRFEVSVVYYRAGYEAVEYHDAGKAVRLQLEQSRAIKCPDVLTHIMTFKIVQAALTAPGVVERFLRDDEAAAVRSTFMHMQVLDTSPSGHEARMLAMNPKKAVNFILKPNLEGGGHNIYRADIPDFLAAIPESEWGNYAIMRMIEPPETHGLLEMPLQRYEGPIVSELGVIGTCLWRRQGRNVEIISNKQAGWTFKTKPAGMEEMNVVKGNGCFDCPMLI